MPQRLSYGRKVSVFKTFEETPARYNGTMYPVNINEQKEKFLKYGLTPQFVIKTVDSRLTSSKHEIRFDLFQEAENILDTVKMKFGDGSKYLEHAFGTPIDFGEAFDYIADYLKHNNTDGEINVYWTPDLTASARMMWHGPNLRYNKPEARRYTLCINNSSDNNFLRSNGIHCLANHEIGTHFFRMFNDGLQPWFSDRKRFGLRSSHCRQAMAAEEGLAALNTVLEAHAKYLWGPALLYYTACRAAELTFSELFEDLKQYVSSPDQRWRHCMRVKRCLKNVEDIGGFGDDQCYFEGACSILRNLDNIDFSILYSGKICVDEVERVKRISRVNSIKLPSFLGNQEKYKRTLWTIGVINGIINKRAVGTNLLRKRTALSAPIQKQYTTPSSKNSASSSSPATEATTSAQGRLLSRCQKKPSKIRTAHTTKKKYKKKKSTTTDSTTEWFGMLPRKTNEE